MWNEALLKQKARQKTQKHFSDEGFTGITIKNLAKRKKEK